MNELSYPLSGVWVYSFNHVFSFVLVVSGFFFILFVSPFPIVLSYMVYVMANRWQ